MLVAVATRGQDSAPSPPETARVGHPLKLLLLVAISDFAPLKSRNALSFSLRPHKGGSRFRVGRFRPLSHLSTEYLRNNVNIKVKTQKLKVKTHSHSITYNFSRHQYRAARQPQVAMHLYILQKGIPCIQSFSIILLLYYTVSLPLPSVLI